MNLMETASISDEVLAVLSFMKFVYADMFIYLWKWLGSHLVQKSISQILACHYI